MKKGSVVMPVQNETASSPVISSTFRISPVTRTAVTQPKKSSQQKEQDNDEGEVSSETKGNENSVSEIEQQWTKVTKGGKSSPQNYPATDKYID
ncbi:unnamed protein product [Arabis nemorensis]|uniref:Uncharacterized protein n=1 Tax=Arabis nemorensis TaxID=586526 RepID=A0A565CMT6_9BRAS|nr:unnamed protein product [Arabis nemorensis]